MRQYVISITTKARHLGISLIRMKQGICNENYKIVLKDIKVLNKWENI